MGAERLHDAGMRGRGRELYPCGHGKNGEPRYGGGAPTG